MIIVRKTTGIKYGFRSAEKQRRPGFFPPAILLPVLVALAVFPAPAQNVQTRADRRDFVAASTLFGTDNAQRVSPEETGTWQEVINRAVFTVFRGAEVYRGEISIRIVEREDVFLRMYPDGVFALSTGLLDFLDDSLLSSGFLSSRRLRELDAERERRLLPFIAAEAGLFAADAEFRAYRRLAAETDKATANEAAGKNGGTFRFSAAETLAADICVLAMLPSAGVFLSYPDWLQEIFSAQAQNPVLQHYAARFPPYGQRIAALQQELSDPANAVSYLRAVLQALRISIDPAEEAPFSALDSLKEKLPDLPYVYRLEALLAHEAWEASLLADPRLTPQEKAGIPAMLPFRQTLPLNRDRRVELLYSLSPEEEKTASLLGERTGSPASARLYRRAQEAYAKAAEACNDFTLHAARAFLEAQKASADRIPSIVAAAAEAALKEAGTSSIIARANYARLLCLSGTDLQLAVKMLEALFPQGNSAGLDTGSLPGKENPLSFVSPGFPGDARLAAMFYAGALARTGETEKAQAVAAKVSALQPQPEYRADGTAEIPGEGMALKSVELGDSTDLVASFWGQPAEITIHAGFEIWTYPDLRAAVVFHAPTPAAGEEMNSLMLDFFPGSPVSFPGELRIGDDWRQFEQTLGAPAYRADDAAVYFYKGLRWKLSAARDGTVRSVYVGL